jgi:hypothetical protein
MIRFGVMCDGPTLRRWHRDTLDRLLAVPDVSLELVIVNGERSERDASSKARFLRLAQGEKRLWRAYNNLYVARRSRALTPRDASDLFEGVHTITCTTHRKGKWSEYFDDDDIDTIRGADLDFILRFSFGIIRGPILDAARYGVWSFHHGDIDRYRGGPPCFWEIANGDPVAGAVLQRLTERLDGGVVLRRGWFRTSPRSYVRTTDDVHLGGVDWPAQVCRDLLRGHTEEVTAAATSSEAPVLHPPDDATTARFLTRLSSDFVRGQCRDIVFADQWNIGVIDSPIEHVGVANDRPPIRWLPMVGCDFQADPFAITAAGRTWALVEQLEFDERLGRIEAVDVDSGERRSVDLPLATHASYPYVVSDGDATYCVPQVTGTNGLRRYRAVREPDRWLDDGELLPDVEARDATVTHFDGRWWLFVTLRGTELTDLHLWFADSLDGPWTPHPRNPVKCDIRSARPAGTPFVVDGVLYRPAQDCRTTYGGAVAINRITTINPDAFAEEVVQTIAPSTKDPWHHGLHTLSAAGDRTLVDGKRRVFRWPATKAAIRARLRSAR